MLCHSVLVSLLWQALAMQQDKPRIDSVAIRVVVAALADLRDAVATRDLPRIMALFDADATLAGTAGHGVGPDVEAYVQAVVDQPATLSWKWDEDTLLAKGTDTVVWFFITGCAVLTPDDHRKAAVRTPMRLTGVLTEHAPEVWRWAQFHGSIAAPS